MREKLRSPGKRVCTVHCVSFKMHPMVASSIPCKLSLCADRAHACAGDSHTSSGIDVACPTTQYVLAIASPHELHGESWPSSSTGTSSFCCNQQYSVTAITTSTGTVAERYAYTAYGQLTILDASASVLSSSAINNRYTYTGREWDATLGLYHFWARWMSPIVGRFVNRDPTSYKGSPFDLYEYARASALKRVDPTGLSWLSSCACFLCYGPIARHVRDLFGSWGYPTHENEKGYDAFLHCLIACEINRTCPQCNNEWDARENSQVVDGQQDLANNLSGRRIVGACFTGCENLWKNGKLTCQKNGSLMPCPSPPPPNQVDL